MNAEEFSSMIRQEMANISRQTESMVEAEIEQSINDAIMLINTGLTNNEACHERFVKQVPLIAFTIFTKKANAIVRIANDEAAVLIDKINQGLFDEKETP